MALLQAKILSAFLRVHPSNKSMLRRNAETNSTVSHFMPKKLITMIVVLVLFKISQTEYNEKKRHSALFYKNT
jgi:hypothetical protein